MTDDRDEIEDILAAARDANRPSDDLVARVLADAAAVQAASSAPAGRPARWRLAWPALGGWLGAGGLAAAAAAGLFIGVAAPDRVDSALGGQLSALGLVQTDDLLPGLAYLLPGEGG
ncbi:hypothetical protein DZD18_06330 [Rhodobacteraceae bacterium W635]|uniref:hypothetical protein n=1 Tax=Nioella halotolerans TaxID=2303578 RepID=UPI000E3DA853|nr:hypothetical protein DZD18_06330 [Rhodobacteraceae bacterium W635]